MISFSEAPVMTNSVATQDKTCWSALQEKTSL